MTKRLFGAGLFLCIATVCVAQTTQPAAKDSAAARAKEKKAESGNAKKGPLDFTMKRIDGEEVPLSKYKGDVVLIVNVASKCGLTPQYKDLQALHEAYADKGLRILAFPANNFRGQEPGSNDEIKAFCEREYGVEFDMFAKVSVKGDDICDLYEFLTSEETNPGFAGEIEWNFAKFLVDRDGKVIRRFHPRVSPSSDEMIKAIEMALKPETKPEKKPTERPVEPKPEKTDPSQ